MSCYVGLMSGTSMDGIDAVLVGFEDDAIQVHARHAQSYPPELRDALLQAIRKPLNADPDPDGDLDKWVGKCFRDAAREVIHKAEVAKRNILAIGSHGQTLRHQPEADPPFSLQIGHPGIIATGTGICTIADFRSADIKAGGQGAPLVPPFHEWLFRSKGTTRVVVNIGGISNITVLPAGKSTVLGFDTGPGNGLMDIWNRRHQGTDFDEDGAWAASGTLEQALLQSFLDDSYFAIAPPKSTGFEYFNSDWIERHSTADYDAANVQATLCELSARTISDAIEKHAANAREVFVCGGGARNKHLMNAIARHLPDTEVAATDAAGLNADWVEAIAFAWLAMQTLNGLPGNLPSVTGANKRVVLGEIHCP